MVLRVCGAKSMKIFSLMVVVATICAVGCQKQTPTSNPFSRDFESLTGKGSKSWEYVQTEEDFRYLDFYRGLYEARKGLIGAVEGAQRVPKVIHFVWLGPNPFPRESVENVRSWMARHPGWVVNFWTDRDRPAPCPGMQEIGARALFFTVEGVLWQGR